MAAWNIFFIHLFQLFIGFFQHLEHHSKAVGFTTGRGLFLGNLSQSRQNRLANTNKTPEID
jgi:hypothetical protein